MDSSVKHSEIPAIAAPPRMPRDGTRILPRDAASLEPPGTNAVLGRSRMQLVIDVPPFNGGIVQVIAGDALHSRFTLPHSDQPQHSGGGRGGTFADLTAAHFRASSGGRL